MSGHPDLAALRDESALDEVERRGLLRHVGACAVCRDRLSAEDPSLLFGLLLLDRPPAEILDRLTAALEVALPVRPAATRRYRPLAGWVAMAASLLLAGLFGSYLWEGDRAPAVDAPPAVADSFEVLYSPGTAQVLDMALGEVQLVMVFDEKLDL